MKPITTARASLAATAAGFALCSCGPQGQLRPTASWEVTSLPAEQVVVMAPPSVDRPPFAFSAQDAALAEEVQRGAFNFFRDAVTPGTGMVVDRTSTQVVSVAGVGFQLAAFCIGAERGWMPRDEAERRVLTILRALRNAPGNRMHGLYFHYLDGPTAEITHGGYETTVSTIDSALLFAGVIVASSYFGGEAQALGDAMLAEANWRVFLSGAEEPKPYERGFISLGWKPLSAANPTGEGRFLPFYWADSGDEQRLVTFLAVGAPLPEHAVDPVVYYRMRRMLGTDPSGPGPFCWFPWSGALFTNFFAHCFIDYASMGPDNPSALGVERRPRIDWWENSRRAALMHRRKAIENPEQRPTLGENAWGLTACDASSGYIVPGLFPTRLVTSGAVPEFDFPANEVRDDFGDGTIAPYGAGSAAMFLPREAMAALAYQRGLQNSAGRPLVWEDPATGGFGFRDSFRLGGPAGQADWTAPDCVAIDQGPLLLGLENARSGSVWKWFHAHPHVKRSMERLRLEASK